MFSASKNKMLKHAQSLKPSSERAQCLRIANLNVSTTIAEALMNDHASSGHAQRSASLMVEAGCATECKAHLKGKSNADHYYGVFTFEDNSTL